MIETREGQHLGVRVQALEGLALLRGHHAASGSKGAGLIVKSRETLLIQKVVLGQALRPSAAPEEGLRRYERTRARRTDAVVRLARRNARFGSLRSRPACWLRDLMVRLVPEAVLLRSLIALGLPQDELDP